MIPNIPKCTIIKYYGEGESPREDEQPQSGDFGFVHHDTSTGKLIRVGERAKYHDKDPESDRWKGYAYWNHMFFCLGDGEIAEAVGGGVKRHPVSGYDGVPWVHVRPTLRLAEITAATFVAKTLEGESYDFLALPFIFLKFLTNMNINVGVGDSQFCSGFVATCLFKPYIWPQDPTFMSPADMASSCKIPPPPTEAVSATMTITNV